MIKVLHHSAGPYTGTIEVFLEVGEDDLRGISAGEAEFIAEASANGLSVGYVHREGGGNTVLTYMPDERPAMQVALIAMLSQNQHPLIQMPGARQWDKL